MKKTLFVATFLVLLLPSFLAASHENKTSEPQMAQVIAAKADIFLEASQHSIVIDTIPKGTTVTLFPSGAKNKKWLYISYLSKKRGSQVTGFVDSRRVEIIKDSSSSAEEKPQAEESEPADANDLLTAMQEEKAQEEAEEEEIQEDQVQEEIAEETQEVLNEQEEGQQEAAIEERMDLEETTEEKPEKNEEKAEIAEKEMEDMQATEEKTTEEEVQALISPEAITQVNEAPDVQPEETEVPELPKVLIRVAVKVPRANIRLMPTTKSPVINQVVSGVELEHVAKTANWHRINLAPNKEGIVLSGYIHNNIVEEIFETVVPPEPDPEPEIRSDPVLDVEEEETKSETESESEQEVPILRKSSFGKYYWVGGGAGYTMPSQSYFGKGLNFGATLGIGVMKHLAVELRIPYFQRDVNSTPGGLSTGQLSSLSLMLSVQGRYPIGNRYIPYLVAGGDYHLNRFSLSDAISQAWNTLGFTIQESVDHTFGIHFGAGVDIFLLQNIVLNLDARYYTANLTGNRTLVHQISQDASSGAINIMKLNSLQAGISVKLFLDPLKRK
jgi:opacity protein-like surface antigen